MGGFNKKGLGANMNKLSNYVLNPNHPVGGNKARVFSSALIYKTKRRATKNCGDETASKL